CDPGVARPRLVVDDADLHRRRYRATAGSLPQHPSAGMTKVRHRPQLPPLAKADQFDTSSGRRRTEGDMSHGVHPVHHTVDHQIEHEEHGHGGGRGKPVAESRNKKIALLISVIALFLALAEMFGKSAQTEGISLNIKASHTHY